MPTALRLLPVTGQKELQTTLMPARHPPDSPSALLSEGPSPAPRAWQHLPPALLFSRLRRDLIHGCPILTPRPPITGPSDHSVQHPATET